MNELGNNNKIKLKMDRKAQLTVEAFTQNSDRLLLEGDKIEAVLRLMN